jgi:hypothetical protein
VKDVVENKNQPPAKVQNLNKELFPCFFSPCLRGSKCFAFGYPVIYARSLIKQIEELAYSQRIFVSPGRRSPVKI